MRPRSLLVPVLLALTVTMAACGSSNEITPGAASDNSSATAGDTAGASDTGAAGSSATSSAPGSSDAAGSISDAAGAWSCPATEDSFTFSSGGDVNVQDLWQKTLLPQWQKDCPTVKISFVFDTHSQNAQLDVAKVGAAIKAGQPVPVDLTENYSNQAALAGLTEPLTVDDVPSLANVSQQAVAAMKGAAVPYRGSSVLLAYNSTKVATPPKTLPELLDWITANPGKFTYNSPSTGGSGGAFVETVVDSKIQPDVLEKMQANYDPSLNTNFGAGLDVLKALTPSIYQNVYPNGNQAVLDLLSKGEIEVAPVWSDMFLSAQASGQLGKEYKVTQISDPSFTGGATYMAIIKSSQHKAAAASFVDWVLQPAQQAKIVTTIAGFPAIPIDSLPQDAQGAFAGVDTQNLRPGLESKTSADLQKQWAETVPG